MFSRWMLILLVRRMAFFRRLVMMLASNRKMDLWRISLHLSILMPQQFCMTLWYYFAIGHSRGVLELLALFTMHLSPSKISRFSRISPNYECLYSISHIH
ncbi:hypothetical protein TorRG33x02_084570 [Trema orientale]|uniref:Uncharacterized protein n=1 Tax=Trema orientale TaxID=63057 RepID=A0A2P5FCW5_TREOI|nr:hypothetical protein TorRG33x02_084570 [Trema orientale]